MPLVRFGVRHEYGLGGKELYKGAVEVEDPKGVLDGVAVAGLVGILRQLGDLAQFAAEVFHDLQEQVASTASRSRKLVFRVQRVEASLPDIEKAILSQSSHIHYAYTPGSDWHVRIRNDQHHFIYDDLPPYIMDSYEECREPPCLQLLDRFDPGGPGSCLKRYSDPTFFKRASASCEVLNEEKVLRERKARKIKRRRSRKQSTHFPNSVPTLKSDERTQFSSPTFQRQSSLSHAGSTFDTTFISDLGDPFDSTGSKDGINFGASVYHPSTSIRSDNTNITNLSRPDEMVNPHDPIYLNGRNSGSCSPNMETTIPHCSGVTWDEKMEIVEPIGHSCGTNGLQYIPEKKSDLNEQELKHVDDELYDKVNNLSDHGSPPKSYVKDHYLKINGIRDVQKANGDLLEEKFNLVAASVNETNDLISEHESSTSSHVEEHYPRTIIDGRFMVPNEPAGLNCQIDEVQYMLENFELRELDLGHGTTNCIAQVADLSEGEDNSELLLDGNPVNIPLDRELGATEDQQVLETNLVVADRESEAICMENVCEGDALSEGGKAVAVVEWSQLDDIESETDNFVDALNMIESESESDYEGQSRKDLLLLTSSKDEMVENSMNERQAEIISCQEPEHEYDSVSYIPKEGTPDNSQSSTALESSGSMETLEHAQSSSYVPTVEIMDCQEPENKFDVVCYDHKEQVPVDSLDSITLLSSANTESLGHDLSSCHVAAAEPTGFQEPALECHSMSYDHKEQTLNDLHNSTPLVSSIYLDSPGRDRSSCHVSVAETFCHQEPEYECHSVSHDHEEQIPDDSDNSTPLVSSIKMEALEHAQSSCNLSAAEGEKLDYLGCLSNEQSVQCIQSSSAGDITQGIHVCANESTACEISMSSFQTPPAGEVILTPHLSLGVGPSSSYSPALWTNGTLLGLQPSKPPVFSVASTVSSVPMNNGSKESQLSNDDQDAQFFKQMPHQIPNMKLDNSVDHDLSNLAHQSVVHGLSNGSVMPHETMVPRTADVKNVSSDAFNESEDKSSLLSLLNRELLKNGLRIGSSGYEDKPKTFNPLRGDFENRSHATILPSTTETLSKEKLSSPVNSPPPSPPLEHMKISFRPIDGFETSRLKLKYPEGVDHHEISVDTFASFQLVPEPTNLKLDVGSDSDDDTFCRSYACMSEDYLTHLSDSDSDKWESGNTSESNDHVLYDDLHRIYSSESTSISPRHGETAHGNIDFGSRSGRAVQSEFRPSFNLPNLDTNIPFAYQEMKLNLLTEESSHFRQPAPQTPPLPPLLWRVSRPQLDAEDDKQDQGSDFLDQPFDPKFLESSFPHLPVVDSTELLSRREERATIPKINKQLDEQKLEPLSQNCQVTNGSGGDDKEDFLHQIRTKSFNLRRTETARSSYAPNTATSDKVTAILQKANAIRQAVASDGENDSWSDA